MKILDVLSLATRMFRTRPMRTFLTILGLSVGIGSVLFLVSLGYGLQKVVLGNITTAESLLSLDVTSGAENILDISHDTVEEISAIENVDFVSPVLSLSAQMSVNGFTGSTVSNIIDDKYFRLSGLTADYGKLDNEDYETGIVISSAGASLFGLSSEEIIGEKVKLSLFVPKSESSSSGLEEVTVSEREEDYYIIGVIEDENSNYIYVPSGSLSDLNFNEFDQLKVKVTDADYVDMVRNEIIERGFLVSSLSDIIDQTNKIFQVVQLVLGIFGLIALLVSSIGMINTMTITLLERINEIGIMRAIGITKKDIKMIFLTEALIMGFLGGIGGVVIGYIGGYLINIGINILANTFGGQSLSLFYYPSWFIYFIIIFSTLIGLITGIFPSIKASKLNPLTALRYK